MSPQTSSSRSFISRKSTISVLLIAVVAFGVYVALAQMHGGPHGAPPPKLTLPEAGITIPMQDFGGRPVVEVTINGKGPYRFILDTGASITVVSDDLSRELSLAPPPGMNVVPQGNGPAPQVVGIPEMQMGDASMKGLIAAVMPIGNLLKGEGAPRGVLNAASFPGYLLSFDYPGKRITLKKGELGAANSSDIFQYSDDAVLPTVPIRVAGHDTVVEVDTGTAFGLTLPVKFLKELPLASQPKEMQNVRTPGGTFPVSVARVDGAIELGSHKINLDEVQFSDVAPGPVTPKGNIGYALLKNFVLTLDAKNRRVRID